MDKENIMIRFECEDVQYTLPVKGISKIEYKPKIKSGLLVHNEDRYILDEKAAQNIRQQLFIHKCLQ